MPEYTKDFKVIASLGFFRTFSGGLIGTGVALFILNYWGSNYFSGLSAAAIALTYIFATVICGRVSDKVGRRTSLLVATGSNLAIAIAYIAIVILVRFTVDAWLLVVIILLRLAEGVANGFFWPILQASISDVSLNCCKDKADFDRVTRKGMGIYNLGWNLGVLFGQVLLSTMLLTGIAVDYALIVPLASQGVNFIIAIVLFRVPANQSRQAPVTEDQAGGLVRPGNGIHHPVKAGLFLALLGLFMIFIYGLSLGSLSTTTTNLYKAWGVPMMVGFTEATRLVFQALTASKVTLGKKNIQFKMIGVAGMLVAMFITMAGLAAIFAPPVADSSAITGAVLMFMGMYAMGGLVFGITYAEAMNMVVMSNSTGKRGLLMGLFESFIGAGFFLGPYLAGYLTEYATFQASYFITALVMMALLVFCLVLAIAARKVTAQIMPTSPSTPK